MTENHADFAKVMGTSAKEFGQTIKDKPIVAIEGFLKSLNKLDSASQLSALKAIGFEGAQGSGEIQKLARQTDSLTKYVKLANEEFRTLGQINKSYAAGSSTTAATFTQVANKVQILASTIGATLLPTVDAIVTAFGGVADWFKSAFENTFLVGVRAIGARLAELPAQFDAIFGSGVAGKISGFFTDLVDSVGFAWRNLPDLVDVAVLMISEKVLNLGESFSALMTNLGKLAGWFGNNWVKLMIDGVRAVGTVFQNLATNIGSIWGGIRDFIEGKGFSFDWTPLTQGFVATVEALPQLVDPAFTSLQDQIDAKLAQITAKEEARRKALATPKVLLPAANLGAPKVAGDQEAESKDFGGKKGKKESAGALELGSAEAASAIAKFRNQGASDQVPKQQLGEAKQQTKVLNRMQQALMEIAARGGDAKLSTYTI
jgi:hypothetical protein